VASFRPAAQDGNRPFLPKRVLSWSWHRPKLHLEQGTVSLIAFFLIKPRLTLAEANH